MKIILKGNVGKNAEIRKVENAGRIDSVVSVWVAENKHHRDGTEIPPVWHKVTIWRKYAEVMAPRLKKGTYVMVEGTGTPKAYVNKQNQLVAYTDIQAEEITILDVKRPDEMPPEDVTEVESTGSPVETAPVDNAPVLMGTVDQQINQLMAEESAMPWA